MNQNGTHEILLPDWTTKVVPRYDATTLSAADVAKRLGWRLTKLREEFDPAQVVGVIGLSGRVIECLAA